MTDKDPRTVSMGWLLERHEVLLLDVYGVLIHHTGPLPGAPELLAHLNRTGKPYYILTNDAARLPATSAAKLAEMGIDVPAELIISSGSLLAGYFAGEGLVGRACAVMGTPDSRELARLGGVEVLAPGQDAGVLLVCDEMGFNFVQVVDDTLSMLFARLDRGDPVRLVLPNPDLVYPKSEHGYGFTAGSIALLLEGALAQRYPGRSDLRFERLGKPNTPIYAEAEGRAGTRDMVMVGDQPGTDILGANRFGIPSALVPTGLGRIYHQLACCGDRYHRRGRPRAVSTGNQPAFADAEPPRLGPGPLATAAGESSDLSSGGKSDDPEQRPTYLLRSLEI